MNANDTAFPVNSPHGAPSPGLSVRAHFASLFLQGLADKTSIFGTESEHAWELARLRAQCALLHADALIYELSKVQAQPIQQEQQRQGTACPNPNWVYSPADIP